MGFFELLARIYVAVFGVTFVYTIGERLGDKTKLGQWRLQSSLAVSNVAGWSLPGIDDSNWYQIGPRATVMAGLLENGVFDETTLFYSNNMETKIGDTAKFEAPWLYRREIWLKNKIRKGEHYFLRTHGITSKADIYVNGVLVAPSSIQQGSYGGHTYDITKQLGAGSNALLIQAYPTNYLRDFAQGFVDWNPYPADNGTGLWRDVTITKTGPVSISSPRVLTNFRNPDGKPVMVNVIVDVTNHENETVNGTVQGSIRSDTESFALSEQFSIRPHETKTIPMNVKIENPKVWWPAQWGSQPLYTVNVNAAVGKGKISDVAIQRRFGIRQVDSHVNSHNDTAFTVNGSPFLVLGGGYSPDIFLRFDVNRVRKIFQYMLDMGLNTVRLEGKQEHPQLYNLADEMGLMIMAGWECCDKWEGWEYNDEANGQKWTENDYPIANASMLHEAAMMQTHPSMLAFLIGSDFWPNDRATNIYLDALHRMDWPVPIIASASKRGYPKVLGPSGMKMDGPYDWVPPNYFYGDQLGAAFGFGSEEGAGVGTPELTSLKKFLSPEDLDSLWKNPDQNQYHMSRYDSSFYSRALYNKALFARYGAPVSLEDYLLKAQMMDYEATRAQFEAFSVRQNATRPATGVIYWMLNSAWPNLHWQLFDYYLAPAGAYFGTKVGAKFEHVAYDYEERAVYLINHSLERKGPRVVSVDLVDLQGKPIFSQEVTLDTTPIAAKKVLPVKAIDQIKDVAFLRLTLKDPRTGAILSRNVYWLSAQNDVLDWENSDWYYTPVTKYVDYKAVLSMPTVTVSASLEPLPARDGLAQVQVVLNNPSATPAVFIHLSVINKETQEEITPVFWSDNYVTIFKGESVTLIAAFSGDWSDCEVIMSGANVKRNILS
ncbi:hypothetical protein CDV55_107758 [Aspergillus turcosus]|uniref:Uncharacterized protein n=1 Tax=Aspergillus turcosus TaxID=1245748 RepID=A0A229X9K0_9EURO|nr:hypothetical protein CDV55_107758 [Aspergillus turcosus]RLL97648.1 hypothetical protein CFD26_101445 [Aspergillus turcosus]